MDQKSIKKKVQKQEYENIKQAQQHFNYSRKITDSRALKPKGAQEST